MFYQPLCTCAMKSETNPLYHGWDCAFRQRAEMDLAEWEERKAQAAHEIVSMAVAERNVKHD